MFHLHDKTRRRICSGRHSSLLGVLPTLLVGGWCLSRHLPGYARAEAEQLGRQLGLNVKLDGVKHLRPGAVLYEGWSLTDPETGQTILRCRLLEIARQQETDEQGQRRTVLTLTAAQPEVEAAALDRIWQCLQRTLEGSCGPLEADLRLSAGRGHAAGGATSSQTLTDVEAIVGDAAGRDRGPRSISAWPALDTPEPIRIRIVRNRQVSPPDQRLRARHGRRRIALQRAGHGARRIEAAGPAMPLPRLHLGQRNARRLGRRSHRPAGRFGPRRPGERSFSAQTQRQRRGDRSNRPASAAAAWKRAAASVTAGPGTIDRSLLAAAVDRLGLVPGNELRSSGERTDYQQLAFFATLDAQGLRLRGRCD